MLSEIEKERSPVVGREVQEGVAEKGFSRSSIYRIEAFTIFLFFPIVPAIMPGISPIICSRNFLAKRINR